MMNCCSKEQIGRVGKNQTASELVHVCPSKLSKRELEDLYFALLQNNLDLKKTLNRQSERVKVLSTKLQRMTATQKAYGKEQKDHKDASAGSRHGHDQQDAIAELKKANERLTERIRQLNMRLCTARQYMKRSQPQLAYSKLRPASSKPVSTSALSQDKNRYILDTKNISVSCQCLHTEEKPTKTTGTETNKEREKEAPASSCDENMYKTLMEELKQKIVNLQEELSKSHDEYSGRISRLEGEVSDLRRESLRVRSDQSQREQDAEVIAARLRAAEAKCDDLAADLLIERGKVAELETQMRAADMSAQLAKTIEDHLNSKLKLDDQQNVPEQNKSLHQCSHSTPKKGADVHHSEGDVYFYKNNKKSDDSGYTDPDRESNNGAEEIHKTNDELLKKISDLQYQLQALKDNAIEHVNKDDDESVVEKRRRKSSRDIDLANKRWEGYDVEDNGYRNSNEQTPKIQTLDDPNNQANVTQKVNENGVGKDKNQNPKIIDDHNKYQIPGPLPVDSSNRRPSMLSRNKKGIKTEPKQLEFGTSQEPDNDSDLERMEQEFHENRGTMSPTNQLFPVSSRRSSEPKDAKREGKNSPLTRPKDLDIEQVQMRLKEQLEGQLKKPKMHEQLDSLDSVRGNSKYKLKKPSATSEIDSYFDIPKYVNDEEPKDSNPNRIPVSISVRTPSEESSKNKDYHPKICDDVELSNTVRMQLENNAQSKSLDSETEPLPSPNRKTAIVRKIEDSRPDSDQSLVSSLSYYTRKAMHRRLSDHPNKASTRSSLDKKDSIQITPKKVEEGNVNIDDPSLMIAFDEAASKTMDMPAKDRNRLESSTSYDDIFKVLDNAKERRLSRNGTGSYVDKKEMSTEKELDDQSVLIPPSAKTSTPVQTDKETTVDGTQDNLDYKNMEYKALESGQLGTESTPQSRRGSNAYKDRTFTVVGATDVVQCRATSPDNTEHEISGLSDLPTERDGSPTQRQPLSPGEDKATSTYTDSGTAASVDDYVTLSEGEMPRASTGKRFSIGEKLPEARTDTSSAPRVTSSQKMEAALEAIGEELSRCRRLLLQSQQSREVTERLFSFAT